MRYLFSFFLSMIFFLGCGTPTEASSSPQWPRPQAYRDSLGVGLDVDWAKTMDGMEYYSPKAAKEFYDRGFRHVRIRVLNDVDEDLLSKLDERIQDSLKAGLIPIIAYQANEFKTKADEESMNRAIAWWETVATRFSAASPLVSFDLIIEVTDALNKHGELLNSFYEKAVTAIRKTNPKRIIFISPRIRSSPEYLSELVIPSGNNGYLMAEWHFYAAGPSKTNKNKLWTTGTEAEKQLIRDKIAYGLAFQKETGILTWVGAWMPGNYNDGNDYTVPEQVDFATFVSGELRKAGIPYAVNSDTKYYNREKNEWYAEMAPVVDAILGKGSF